jgi:hypothetical protein
MKQWLKNINTRKKNIFIRISIIKWKKNSALKVPVIQSVHAEENLKSSYLLMQ